MSGKGDPIISFRNVGVTYWLKRGAVRRKRYWALRNVSFDLYRGESLGIVGRNGCGKSTLLRLLANVMRPDHGEVRGVENLRTSLLSLQLGFVDYLSGRENAILSGMFLGMTKQEISARMERIIAFSELGEFIDQPLSTYSSGMRARLGFSVAFQLEPDVLLVDEVTGVGDSAFREKSFQVMKERLSSKDNTIVFVSHQAQQVRVMCERAIWIDEGEVRAVGDVDDVVSAYEGALRQATQEQQQKERAPEAAREGKEETLKEGEAPEPEATAPPRVFAREEGSRVVYEVKSGMKRRLESADEFRRLGGSFDDVYVLPHDIFAALGDAERPKPEDARKRTGLLACWPHVCLLSGFHKPEEGQVWTEQHATLRLEHLRRIAEAGFSVYPPQNMHAPIPYHVTLTYRETGARTTLQLDPRSTDGAVYRIEPEGTVAHIDIVTEQVYVPSDHGSLDTRPLGVSLRSFFLRKT